MRRARFGLMLAVLFSSNMVSAQDKDRFTVGEAVPVFTLKVVNPDDSGQNYISVDRFFGAAPEEPKKLLLVSFFATYCEPCKREMPYLAALHDLYASKGLPVLLVSIDKETDKVDIAKDLAKKAGVKFPVLSDRFNIVAKRYMIEKLPCVYLINGEGKVVVVSVGYSEDVPKLLLNEIRKGVGDPVTDPVPPSIASFLEKHGPKAGEVESVDVPGAAESNAETAAAAAGAANDDAEDKDKGAKKKPKAGGKKPKKKK
jgi:thiol-disulfide isomerase/thioredoxin